METYEKVKLKRLCLGLSTQQVADKIGVTKQAISVYESGASNSKSLELVLCHVLNLGMELIPFEEDCASKQLYEDLLDSEIKDCLTVGTMRKLRSRIMKAQD